ncbi:MAG TPA: XrtA/PEP-CTERM system histidine kinase PrsK [Verrucomicrobiae bacterium]|nr:XrtA/PEP-CTERM system histidine kinase PrsK [Verrucomicrobiae bacterium]
MTSTATVSLASALVSGLLALAVIVRGRRSPANWLFCGGMVGLACDSLFFGLSHRSAAPDEILFWHKLSFASKAILPGLWLGFSLTYSRGNYRDFLTRWRLPLMLAFFLPVVLVTAFWDDLIRELKLTEDGRPYWLGCGLSGNALHVVLLVSLVVVLMNLEKTFRTAVGTLRWRIKFVVLGLCVIFGAKIYTASQAMLYSAVLLSYSGIEAAGLIIGCILIAVSYIRAGRTEIDVYPSHAVLYNSITIVVAGVYLLTIGLLAKLVAQIGGDTGFPVKALLVLLGIVGLALVLMSDRVRQKMRHFVSRHLQRPLYDYRTVWKSFTETTISRVEENDLCNVVVRFTSDLFQVLSVTIWLVDRDRDVLVFGSSTSLQAEEGRRLAPQAGDTGPVLEAFRNRPEPVDIDSTNENWAVSLRSLTPGEFRKGGHRVCVPVIAGGDILGLISIGDRVSGVPWSVQDTDLLKCIADQTAACLRNIQLSHRLMQAREMEAFQTMSAFFVHDLKNTASTLSLMLKNLPVHFHDPAFREDALRGIGNTVTHINSLIERLTMLRQQLAIHPAPCEVNAIVTQTLQGFSTDTSGVRVVTDLGSVQPALLDREQIHKVILNLLLNAREALAAGGEIRVETRQQNGWAVIAVTDNGCGMSEEFMQRSLFRPFQTTKKRGIGIGMFQSRMIVEAHKGRMEVQSSEGRGTTFRVLLPSNAQ